VSITPPEKHRLLNERELLMSLAEGDEQAFTELYSYYQPRLLRYVFPFALNELSAEEIVQDVLFRLWVRRETLQGIASLERYLQRMAKNLLLDKLKRLSVEKKYIAHLTQFGNTRTNIEDDFLLKEYQKIAAEAIDQLPPKQKLIFLLRHSEDLTLAEIAARTGSTVMAVQKNLVRAVQFIKTALQKHGEWGTIIMILLFPEKN